MSDNISNILREMDLLLDTSSEEPQTRLTYRDHGGKLSKETCSDMTDNINEVAAKLQFIKIEPPYTLDGLQLCCYSGCRMLYRSLSAPFTAAVLYFRTSFCAFVNPP